MRTVFAIALFVGCTPVFAQVTWNIDNTSNIGGNAVTSVVGAPTVVSTPFGNGMKFDGNDGLIVNANPVAGAATFTVEMLFRPDPVSGPVTTANNQPRVLFLQSVPNPPDHRGALEARIEPDNQHWHIDTFLLSQRAGQASPTETIGLTLEETSKLHPLGVWYNYTMTYDGTRLNSYLNGQLESTGLLAVQGMAGGRTSIGMRYSVERFFVGIVAKVRFTPGLVDPEDFLLSYAPGDFDRNGAIELADFSKWQSDFGSTAAAIGDGADGNRDGLVDAADYTVWRDAYDASGAAATLGEQVPECGAAFGSWLGWLAASASAARKR
jgi:Concanavalin A-like lectin/glucanases superfamily